MAQKTSSSGLQISYDDKKEGVILRNLSALIKSLGSDHALNIGFQLSPPLHVLGSLIEIRGIQGDYLPRHIIFGAAIRLQSSSNPSISDLVEALGGAAQNYLTRPSQEYHTVLPLNVDQKLLSDNGSFSIQGVELLCDNWTNIQNTYAVDKLTEKLRDYIGDMTSDLWNWSGTPLIVKNWSRNGEEAFQKAEGAYDLLRAVLNFTNDSNRIQLQRFELLGNVPPPAGYGVFLPDGTFEDWFVNVEHLRFQSNMLPKDLKIASGLLEKLGSNLEPNGTTSVFIETLRIYNHALDATNWQNGYLSLWQSLETLTTFDLGKKYDMSKVVERASTLLGIDNETSRDFLNICADQRNNLVHRGQFSDEGQSEVVLLKSVVRACLKRFLVLVESYPTQASLTEFFSHASLSSNILLERKRVIENILNRTNNG